MLKNQTITVEQQDLNFYRNPGLAQILHGILAGLAGFFGTIYVSLSLGFINANLAYGVAFGIATYGFARNWLLRRFIVGRRYVTVFRLVRFARFVVVWSLVFFFLTSVPLLFTDFFSLSLVQTLGLSYLALGLSFQWYSSLDHLGEGGLSLSQFLSEKGRGLEAFGWLKRGLRKIERQLELVGISVPKGTLALGASYAILNGTDLEPELRTLGDWVRRRQNQQPGPSLETILFQAKRAEKSGVKPSKGWEDYMASSWAKVAGVAGAVILILTVIKSVLDVWARLNP